MHVHRAPTPYTTYSYIEHRAAQLSNKKPRKLIGLQNNFSKGRISYKPAWGKTEDRNRLWHLPPILLNFVRLCASYRIYFISRLFASARN